MELVFILFCSKIIWLSMCQKVNSYNVYFFCNQSQSEVVSGVEENTVEENTVVHVQKYRKSWVKSQFLLTFFRCIKTQKKVT